MKVLARHKNSRPQGRDLSGVGICLATSVHSVDDNRLSRKILPRLVSAGASVSYVFADRGRPAPNVPGVTLVRVPVRSAGRAARVLDLGRRVHAAAVAQDPALTIVPDPELLPWFRWQPAGTLVFDMHEDTAAALGHRAWVPALLRRAATWTWLRSEPRLLSAVPLIFTEDSYAESRDWAGNWTVVHNFPDTDDILRSAGDILQPANGSQRKVAYVGGVTRGRGGWLMLDLARALWERSGGTVTTIIVGPCTEPDLVAALREAEGQGYVEWAGRMEPREAWRTISDAHVGLALLQPEPNYVRSLPTKLLEYAVLGLRVVASDFPLYREVTESIGFGRVVDVGRRDGLVQAVEAELEAASSWRGSAEHDAVVERIRSGWSWKSEGDRLIDFLGQVLEG